MAKYKLVEVLDLELLKELIEIDEFNPTELRPDTTQWYLVEENADG